MRNALIEGIIAVMLLAAAAADAYPTLSGPTGMSVIPTGRVPSTGMQIAGDWAKLGAGASIPFRALVTVGRGVEVGGLYDPFDDKAPFTDAWGLNAKMAFVKVFGGDSALGAQFRREYNAGGRTTEFTQGYFAWTTDFDAEKIDYSNVELTLGTNWTRVAPTGAAREYALRAFAGAIIYFSRDIELLGEYQSKNTRIGDLDPTTSVSIRYHFNPEVSAQFGLTNSLGLLGAANHELFGGINLTLPMNEQ